MATVGRDGVVKLWDTTTWQELLSIPGTHMEPRCLEFSPDGATLAVNHRGQIRLYNSASGQLRFFVGEEAAPTILCGQFSPEGNILAIGAIDGRVSCIDVASRSVVAMLVGHVGRVAALDFAPNGKTLATGGWDTTVRLWDIIAGQEVAAWKGHRGKVHAVSFSPNGKILASGGEINDGLGELYWWRATP